MIDAVKPSFKDLKVTPEDVARYAGGSLYIPDAQRLRLAADILEQAYAFICPAFVFAAHHIDTIDSKQGLLLLLSQNNSDSGAVFVVSAVCTIGPRLEKEASNLMKQGKVMDALFMDAAGVSILEALSDAAYAHIEKEASKRKLFTGCRFGPGYGNIPVSAQKYLFRSVNAEAIGVKLGESGILIPLKSLSFCVKWSSVPPAEGNPYKCLNCPLKNCLYRIEAKQDKLKDAEG
jgi:hypothetical protein